MKTPESHTFNRAVMATINKALKISGERGGEYQDSWAVENLITPFLDNLLASGIPANPCRRFRRLIIMASMIDIKISRLGGAWKDDTAIDMINYVAAYTQLRSEYDATKAIPGPPFNPT